MKKGIIGFIIGGIVCSIITYASAAILFKADEVQYTSTKAEINNVQDAIDDIYENFSKSSVIVGGVGPYYSADKNILSNISGSPRDFSATFEKDVEVTVKFIPNYLSGTVVGECSLYRNGNLIFKDSGNYSTNFLKVQKYNKGDTIRIVQDSSYSLFFVYDSNNAYTS